MTRVTILPGALSLPDACRAAVVLLDRYAAARETATRCATAGASAREHRRELVELAPQIARALYEVLVRVELAGGPWERWREQVLLAKDGVGIDADAWAVELAGMAEAAPGARDTEPEGESHG